MEQPCNKIFIEEISNDAEPTIIKNFLLSSNARIKKHFSFEEPFIFDGFVIGFCVRGTAKLKINFKEYQLAAGAILLLAPNQVIKLDEKSDDFSMENLFLSFDMILEFPSPVDFELFDYARRTPCVKVSEEMISHLLKYHSFISSEYGEIENIYREEIVKTLLYALMLEISGIYKANENTAQNLRLSKHEDLSDSFFRLLNKHYKQERSVAFYADKMCLTPKYLSSAIKKITGKSILGWIDETVITESKVMLKTTDLTVLQISEELNFANPSFFVQFFKHHTGTTPLKYRNS